MGQISIKCVKDNHVLITSQHLILILYVTVTMWLLNGT